MNTFQTGGKRGESLWIDHIKATQVKLGCSYKIAMKEASKSYVKPTTVIKKRVNNLQKKLLKPFEKRVKEIALKANVYTTDNQLMLKLNSIAQRIKNKTLSIKSKEVTNLTKPEFMRMRAVLMHAM